MTNSTDLGSFSFENTKDKMLLSLSWKVWHVREELFMIWGKELLDLISKQGPNKDKVYII